MSCYRCNDSVRGVEERRRERLICECREIRHHNHCRCGCNRRGRHREFECRCRERQ